MSSAMLLDLATVREGQSMLTSQPIDETLASVPRVLRTRALRPDLGLGARNGMELTLSVDLRTIGSLITPLVIDTTMTSR